MESEAPSRRPFVCHSQRQTPRRANYEVKAAGACGSDRGPTPIIGPACGAASGLWDRASGFRLPGYDFRLPGGAPAPASLGVRF
jgi:hypothetical protein